MDLPSNIQFSTEKIKKAFEGLKDDSQKQEFSSQLTRALMNIERNAFCGVQIPKRLIPKEYFQRYKIKNLWKYNLSGGWRVLYSIESNGIIVMSIIICWLNHKEYERRFKY